MNRLFVALMASAFLMTGVVMAAPNNNGNGTRSSHSGTITITRRQAMPTPKPTQTPKPTPKPHGKTYNASHSNTAHHMATPKPTPTPKRSHMAVKGSGVPTCANGIRYVSSTGAVICNSEQSHAHFVTPKLTPSSHRQPVVVHRATPKPTHKP
jgi:hypothetical protein